MGKPQLGDHLTNRESELLDHLIEGLTTDQIASAMKISHHTVKFHLCNVQAKLGGHNRWHMAAMWAAKRTIETLGWLAKPAPKKPIVPMLDGTDITRPVTVPAASFAAFERALANPPAATPALRALFGKSAA